MGRFSGKTALITGACSGIGRALARKLASEGACVVLASLRMERLQELVQELGPSVALAVKCDVTKDGEIEAAVNLGISKFGKIDIVVANAGYATVGPVEALALPDFRAQFETNVFGVVRTMYAALDELKKNHGQLVIIGSLAGHLAVADGIPYTMSKFALRGLAGALRKELAPRGVSVTLIVPSFVETEIFKVDNRNALQKWLTSSPENAANEIATAIARRNPERVLTFHGKLIVWLQRFFPWMMNFL